MDAREFKQRFMPFHRRLYQVAYHLTSNAQDAEDLLQDTYLKLWQKRESLRYEAITEAYLVTVMRNLFREQIRLKRIDASEDIDDYDEPPDGCELARVVEDRDEVKHVETLIGEMPERDGVLCHPRRIRRYQLPVFSMLAHGSAGARASPSCSSSMEMPSGVLMKAMRPSRGGRLIVTPASARRWQVA